MKLWTVQEQAQACPHVLAATCLKMANYILAMACCRSWRGQQAVTVRVVFYGDRLMKDKVSRRAEWYRGCGCVRHFHHE